MSDSGRFAEARAASEAWELPERLWAVGELRHDRPRLVLDGPDRAAASVYAAQAATGDVDRVRLLTGAALG